jgi:signal transduction histidine kinase
MVRQRMDLWARAAGAVVAAIGASVLCGWAFDIDALKGPYGPITMKTNAAVALLLCGIAVWATSRGVRGLAVAGAAAATAIGAATLSQHLFGWNLGIDQFLFTEPPGAAATTSPNRMGPHGATSFILAGSALLLLRRQTPRSIRAAEAMAFTGFAFSLVAITGYTYGATELFGIAPYTGIALHTAVALLLLHSGILAASGASGAMATFADEGAAGLLVRRLALPVVALPLVLGYLLVLGREGEILDRGLSMSIFAVSVITILLATIWHTAEAIGTSDHERQRARDEAERANRLKDQFIAILSHELRTPLNVMLGRLQTLERDVDRETRVRAARIVARNGRLLARLVEDLLDLSRIAAGQIEIAPVPSAIGVVVRSAVDAVAPDAAIKGIGIVTAIDDRIAAIAVDPMRMHQVVCNLLSNAVKFTPSGGRVELHARQRDDQVELSVTDTGIGFEPEFAAHLFEPFRQADPSFSREHGGLGLGLSIARHLVELHGGSIAAASAGRGLGATFTITLPVARSGHPSAPAAMPQATYAGVRT